MAVVLVAAFGSLEYAGFTGLGYGYSISYAVAFAAVWTTVDLWVRRR